MRFLVRDTCPLPGLYNVGLRVSLGRTLLPTNDNISNERVGTMAEIFILFIVLWAVNYIDKINRRR